MLQHCSPPPRSSSHSSTSSFPLLQAFAHFSTPFSHSQRTFFPSPYCPTNPTFKLWSSTSASYTGTASPATSSIKLSRTNKPPKTAKKLLKKNAAKQICRRVFSPFLLTSQAAKILKGLSENISKKCEFVCPSRSFRNTARARKLKRCLKEVGSTTAREQPQQGTGTILQEQRHEQILHDLVAPK